MFSSLTTNKNMQDDLAALKKPVPQQQPAPTTTNSILPQSTQDLQKRIANAQDMSKIVFAESLDVGASSLEKTSLPRLGWQVLGGKQGEQLSDKANSPLNLAELHATIQLNVPANYSKTTLIMTFVNSTSKVLEGDLELPLPEQAVVCGFGLDVDGELVDAVPVEKEKARVIFETEVRKNKDPALIEHVSGNVFRTRVYPMPANGYRQIKVVYMSQLGTVNQYARHWFPFDSSAEQRQYLKVLSLDVQVFGAEKSPKLILVDDKSSQVFCTLPELGAGTHSAVFASRTLSAAQDPIAAAKGFVISIEKSGSVNTNAQLEIDSRGRLFFAAQDFVQPAPVQATAPSTIGIIWDASLSRDKTDKKNEIALVESYLKQCKNVTVKVSLLRYRLEDAVTFAVNDDNSVAQVTTYLNQVFYDGGTSLSSIANFFKANQVGLCLLFSDGFSNCGPEEIDTNSLNCPLYSIANATRINNTLLSFLAEKTGGQYVNLLNKNTTAIDKFVSTIGVTPYSFLYAENPNSSQLVDILPSKPTPAQGTFTLSGRIKGALQSDCTITLCYGYGATVTNKVTFTLSPKNVAQGEVLNLFWASKMVEELSAFPDMNKIALTNLGKEYGIVTPGTSLLVLESLEQHLKYKVAPAASRTKLYKAYQDAIHQEVMRDQQTIANKLNDVYSKWSDRVKWHATDFSTRQNKNSIQPSSKLSSLDSLSMRSEMCCSAAPPMARSLSRSRQAPVAESLSLDDEEKSEKKKSKKSKSLSKDSKKKSVADDDDDDESSAPVDNAPKIAVKQWDPQTPYILAIKKSTGQEYQAYVTQRASYYDSPAFYFDCADFFFKNNMRDYALRCLTNIVELVLENGQLVRIMGYKLHVEKELELAKYAFERVLKLRPEEPQSHRDLALVLDDKQEYDKAMELLWKVITGKWDSRFNEIEQTALVELNRIISIINSNPKFAHFIPAIPTQDKRFISKFDLDMRISLAWDTDMVDIDLHVLDPWNEDCYFANRNSWMGAYLSRDFTQGYGPEEFMLRQARPGIFKIKTHYYASHQQSLTGGTTLLCTIFTNYARPNESKQLVAVRLATSNNDVTVGEIEWK